MERKIHQGSWLGEWVEGTKLVSVCVPTFDSAKLVHYTQRSSIDFGKKRGEIEKKYRKGRKLLRQIKLNEFKFRVEREDG